MKRYWFGHAIAIVTVILLAYAGGRSMGPESIAPPKDAGCPTQVVGKESPTIAETMFEYQMKSYQQGISDIKLNLLLQVAFVVLGIVVIGNRAPQISMPAIDVKVNRSWLFFLVPFGLLFLWLRFGFMFDAVIKARSFAWNLMPQMGIGDSAPTHHGAAALFEDAGLVDAWFVQFRPCEHAMRTDHWLAAAIFFGVTYCMLLAAGHAVAVALLQMGARKYRGGFKKRWWWLRPVTLALPWCVFGLFALSHWDFRFGGRNPNWAQGLIALLSVSVVYGLLCLDPDRD